MPEHPTQHTGRRVQSSISQHRRIVFRHIQDDRHTEHLADHTGWNRERQIPYENQFNIIAIHNSGDFSPPTRITWVGKVADLMERTKKRGPCGQPMDLKMFRRFGSLETPTVSANEMHFMAGIGQRVRHFFDSNVPRIIRIPNLANPHDATLRARSIPSLYN